MNDDDLKALLDNNIGKNEPLMPKPSREIKRISYEEAKLRKEAIAKALVDGKSRDQIIRVMGKAPVYSEDGDIDQPGFGMSEHEVDLAIKSIHAEWDEEAADYKNYAKATAIRRLLAEIGEARRKGNYNAVANLEKVLMMVQGTAEPVEIQTPTDTRITEALLKLLGEMNPANVRIMIEKERALINSGVDSGRPLLPAAEVSSVTVRRKGKMD